MEKLSQAQVDDKTVRLWDATTGKHLKTITGHTALSKVYVSHRMEKLSQAQVGTIVGCYRAGIRVVRFSPDGKTTHRTTSENTHRAYVICQSVCFSPDGKTIASASWDNTVRLWNTTTGQHLKTLTGHTENVESVCFSPDGRTIASASWDDTVRLWNTTTGNTSENTHRAYVICQKCPFLTGWKTIASASTDETVRLWDATTGKHLKTLTGHT